MTLDIASIKHTLCNTFCEDVEVALRDDMAVVSLPMSARDGDQLVAYLRRTPGGWRVSDMGSTMMRLSYENDLDRLLTGARAELFDTMLKESGLSEDDGDLFVDVPSDALSRGLFVLGQGLTRIEDLGLWSRSRVESTFYQDLRGVLDSFLPADEVEENYVVPGLPNADSYPIDYFIHTQARPLYLFGVTGQSKARLATIILQHLLAHDQRFESLVVCENIDDLPKQDRNRLMNAANDVVPSIVETGAIEQKVKHRLTA